MSKTENHLTLNRLRDTYPILFCLAFACFTHLSRHNFGTHVTLSQGVSIETVSKMMGHKHITTTQIYAKVTDRKVDEDMKRLKARTASGKVNLYEDETLRAGIRYPSEKTRNKNIKPLNNQSA